MSVIGSNVLAGASGQADAAAIQIDRSLRFNSADSASLSLASYSGSGTFSCWVKRCKLGSAQTIITNVAFAADDTLNSSSAVFRDPSAWLHIVVSSGGTYVNGSSVGSGSAVTPSAIGSGCDLYLADVHFIDGQALAATDFGEYDDNNVWQPKAYSGSYGTNGFKLDFSDNTSTTTIAEDSSGNNNDWTANNISVASGAGNDSLLDSPTNYDDETNVGGNYCTWNPVDMEEGVITLSEGNLKTITTSSTGDNVRGTFGFSSGKWYWECTVTDFSGGFDIGFATPEWDLTAGDVGGVANSWAVSDGGTKKAEGSTTTGATSAFNSIGKVIGIAFDADAGSVKYFIDGTDQGVIFSGLDTSYTYMPAMYVRSPTGNAMGGIWNFGQRGSFTYDPPSGYKGLCTQNLDESSYASIPDGSQQFQIKLWNGTGSSGGSNQTITGYNFEPQFAWIKNRSDAEHHALFDQIRGATKVLYSSLSAAEASQANGLVNFTSDGFQLGIDGKVNALNKAHVGWAWNSATSTSSNSDGSITSSVRANSSAGFSIVSYTGDGAASATIGHGLNAVPEMIMLKNRDDSDEGVVYHVGTDTTSPENYFLRLFSTSNGNAARNDGGARWNDTAPTSSVFSVGTEDEVNAGENYIAYCFTSIPGYSAFGSYTGNGNADGPFVALSFKPRWIMFKNTTSAIGWYILDTQRDEHNVSNTFLFANTSGAEGNASTSLVDILSSGFKLRGTGDTVNASASVYVYAAFAEHPFKTARAR
jgi:hypothetical protein